MKARRYRKYSPQFRLKVLSSKNPEDFIGPDLPESTLRSWLKNINVSNVMSVQKKRKIYELREEIKQLKGELRRLQRLVDEKSNIKPHRGLEVNGRLSRTERRAMRLYITSPKYQHLGIRNLVKISRRLGHLNYSEQTWYRYKKQFGWQRSQRPRRNKYKSHEGIRAKGVNDIWHCDSTFYRATQKRSYYITFVVDNFSRRILACVVQMRLQSLSVVKCINLAVESSLCHNSTKTPQIITDQGSESRSFVVSEALKKHRISRLFSRKDVGANCCVEAVFRQLKHRSLRRFKPKDPKHVRQIVSRFVTEYNSKIPHNAFKNATPDEIYFRNSISSEDS